MSKRGWRWIRRAAAAALLGVIFVLGAGWFLARPWPQEAGLPPADLLDPAGSPMETVTIPSASGSELRAWFLEGRPELPAILLLHGLHSSRRAMLPRARFLARAGYPLLLVDLQAQGESPGSAITFGGLEARDAEASIAWLQRRCPGRPVGAIGVSMGGAALLLAHQPLPLCALVLESVYPTITLAVEDRLRRFLGPPGPWFAPILLMQMRPRLGFDPEELRPIDRIATVGCPLLLMHGRDDESTHFGEAEAMQRCAAPPCALWAVEGAAHVDLYARSPQEYERRVLDFFARSR